MWRKQVWGKPPLSDAHGTGMVLVKAPRNGQGKFSASSRRVGKANRVESRTHAAAAEERGRTLFLWGCDFRECISSTGRCIIPNSSEKNWVCLAVVKKTIICTLRLQLACGCAPSSLVLGRGRGRGVRVLCLC